MNTKSAIIALIIFVILPLAGYQPSKAGTETEIIYSIANPGFQSILDQTMDQQADDSKSAIRQKLAASASACNSCNNSCNSQMSGCMKNYVRNNHTVGQCNAQQASCFNYCRSLGC